MMRMIVVVLLLAFTVSMVSGCKIRAKRFDYQSIEETPKGPGIFTGKDGAVTIGR